MRSLFPNMITVTRLFLAIIVLAMVASSDEHQAGGGFILMVLVLFSIGMGTDWLDGYLARRLSAVSQVGRILDPFVDKVFICGLFVLLSGQDWYSPAPMFSGSVDGSGIAPWVAVVIVIRELMVTMLRGFGESVGQDYSARWGGKIKLVVQSGFLGFVFGKMLLLPQTVWVAYLRDCGLVLTVLVTVGSAWEYVRMAVHNRNQEPHCPDQTRER